MDLGLEFGVFWGGRVACLFVCLFLRKPSAKRKSSSWLDEVAENIVSSVHPRRSSCNSQQVVSGCLWARRDTWLVYTGLVVREE